MEEQTLTSRSFGPVETGTLLFLAVWLLAVTGAAFAGKLVIAGTLSALPLMIWLIVSPRVGFYLYLLLVPICLSLHFGAFDIWPFDIVTGLMALGLVTEALLRGDVTFRRTPFDLPLLFLILATWLSALFAFDRSETVVPSVRILVLFIAFRCVFVMCRRLGVRRILMLYIHTVFALSVINVAMFVYYGGTQRIYGPAWLAFENYSMTALPMALAFLIWSGSRRERIWYGTIAISIAMAIFASGSRGALLGGSLGVLVLLLAARKKLATTRGGERTRSLGRLVIVVGVPVAVLLLFSSTLFGNYMVRLREMLQSLATPRGTIAVRAMLWTTAIKAWLLHPICGIGIGNFRLVAQIVPEFRLNPVWYYASGGMSSHNVVLQYAAETGIIGVVALLTTAVAGVRTAAKIFRQKLARVDTQTSAALLVAMWVFALSIFFMRAWTWSQEGHVMAILFGMTAAWYTQHTVTEK
jgi:O-antigen ligase